MALGFFNPVFGNNVANNVVDSLASRALAPVKGVVESKVRKLTGGITNNPLLAPIVGSVLGSLDGVRGEALRTTTVVSEKGPLGDLRNRADPLWAHNFEAAFTSNGEISPLDGAFIEDVDLPFYQFDRLSHYRGGKNYYFPGDFDLSQFTLKLYENRFLTTTQFLHAWKGRIRNPDNTVNMPTFYKRNLVVSIKDDRKDIVATATLIGCWPISPSPLGLSSSSADRVIISAEFSADDIKFEFKYAGI